MPDLVECLSSPSYPGDPLALTWEGKRCTVDAILDRWRSPQAIHFRVRATPSNDLSRHYEIFELAYDFISDAWRVTPLTTSASLT